MTSMTTLAPVAPIMSASAVAARAGAPSALQASPPSLALQGTVAGSSFAGLLAASGRQGSTAPAPAPAPSADKPPSPQAGSQPARRSVDGAGARTADQLAQTAPTAQARPTSDADTDDSTDLDDAPSAEATDTTDDHAGVAEAADERSAPSHKARKTGSAAGADAHAAAGSAQVVPPSPADAAGASHGVEAATSDSTASSVETLGDGRRPSHGIGADSAAGVASDTTALQAAAAARDDKAAAIAGQPDLRAVAQTATADFVAVAVQASDSAAAPGSAFTSAADTRDNVGAAGAAAAASAVDLRSSAASVAGPTSVAVTTPTDAPDFREALGAQVSLLVKDGVQTAELHLNPADMGPISVHIAMDGAQAKIEFGADSADTRRLIETGLPELASALRDAGFTLSGGGVSDHRQGRQSADADARGNDATRRVDVADDALTLRRTVSAASLRRSGSGGLDLYA